jgi:molybdenum cofactor cytidylyltransferase
MVLLQDGFAALGVPAIHRCAESDSQWITIDEIGYLEAQSEVYHDALRQLLEKKQVAMVVRKQNLPFITELCDRIDVFVVDLDVPFENIGCVIMASGLGKRFGGNKLMADFHGAPLICRALDATESIFARRVVVTRHDDVAELCHARGIEVIRHNLPYRSDTVRLGLSAMSEVDRCMFLPGDQPLLHRNTIAMLAFAAAHTPDTIWRTACDGVPGSPVIFPTWTYPELLDLPEGKGGGVVAKRHPQYVRLLPVADPLELADTDSPEELERLKRAYQP